MTHPGDALSAWLDGELAPAEADGVAAHVAACPACTLELDDVAYGRGALRSLSAVEPPPGVLVPRAALHPGDGLSAWLDGQLGHDEAAGIQQHVDKCPACAAELDEVGAARAAVRAMPALDPPAGLRPRAAERRGPRVLALVGSAVAVLVGVAGLAAVSPPAAADAPEVSELVAAHDRVVGAPRAAPLRLGGAPAGTSATAGGAPTSLAQGFTLVSVERRGPGKVVHARYEDAAGSALSLFRSSVDWSEDGLGDRIDVAGRRGHHSVAGSDEVVCWKAGGASYAVVGAGPSATAVAATVPTAAAPSTLSRARAATRRVLELVG